MTSRIYPLIKRTLDFLGAIVLIIPLIPVIVVVGIAIFMEDGLPIFYKSRRMGRSGKVFDMIKFRSMLQNAPDIRNSDGSTFNAPEDARVTRTGKFLRRTSIDELPQILNVLVGSMSFVGPRPSLATTPYSEYDDVRKKRVSVRPGITGFSQAYYRNSIGQKEKFTYDCYYVDNMSFSLDLRIIFKTIKSVCGSKDIYNKKD